MQSGKDSTLKSLSRILSGRANKPLRLRENTIAFAKSERNNVPIDAKPKSKPSYMTKKVLGAIQSVRVNRYGVRPSHRETHDAALVVNPAINYDLWLGPAEDQADYAREAPHRLALGFQYRFRRDGKLGCVHVLDTMFAMLFFAIR